MSQTSALVCKAEGIWFAYRQTQWVLEEINLQVPTEGFLTILGPSGSGKTTLVKILAGLLQPQQGRVELLGSPIVKGTGLDPKFRQRIGYIPQQLGLVRGITALENVLLGALARMPGPLPMLGLYPKDEIDRALGYLDFLGIADKAHEQVYRLSGGERQRVAIARTLLQNPQIIFADEFLSDLDLPRAVQILSAMRDLARREKIAFVVNLHEILLVQKLGSEVVVLKEGRIVRRGSAREITTALSREVFK